MPKGAKNVSIKITREMALQMLPHMEEARTSLARQLKDLEDQIAKINRVTQGEQGKPAGPSLLTSDDPFFEAPKITAPATLTVSVPRRASGRAPKGASLAAITDLFKKHSELSFNDVVRLTGVSVSTAHRILQKLEQDGEIKLGTEGAFKWNQAA